MYKSLLFLLLFILAFNLNAQPFYQEDFKQNVPYKTESLTEGKLTTKWEYRTKGISAGSHWGSRKVINSPSSGGVLIFDANRFHDQGAGVMEESIYLSNPIDCSKRNEVWVKFSQYYRAYNSECELLVSVDGGNNWIPFDVNVNIGKNIETGRNDYQTVDITNLAANQSNVQIGFRFKGDNYFWMVDDLELWEEEPYEETFPPRLGEFLRDHDIDYRVDEKGGAYPPNQLLVKFASSVTPTERNTARTQCGAVLIDECKNGELQLWEIDGEMLVSSETGLTALGKSTGLEERTAGAMPGPKIEGEGPNYFVFNDLQDVQPVTTDPLADFPTGGQASGVVKNEIKIAILDTGLDFTHEALKDYFAKSREVRNGKDSDNNTYVDDYIGWNFVGRNNNTNDDHSHGTHVTGILMQHLKKKDVVFSLLPVKTHDAYGLSDIFKTSCGSYYAMDNGAKIINASWGYYGNPSEVMQVTLNEAETKNVIVVASSGNEGVDLSVHEHYPSSFPNSNVISVGAHGTGGSVARYSNFSPVHMDILAPGEVESCLPGNNWGSKKGTSMAAPAVAAAAAIVYNKNTRDMAKIIAQIQNCATRNADENSKVRDGKQLNLNTSCLSGIKIEAFEKKEMKKEKQILIPKN